METKYKPPFMTEKDYEPFVVYEDLDVETLKILKKIKQKMIDTKRTEQVSKKLDCIGIINNIIKEKIK
jgi:hypothetical protein